MQGPRLSVITAVRNLIDAGRADMIRRNIESVKNQRIAGGIEHIIADGKSTDGTLDLLSGYVTGSGADCESSGYCFRLVSKKDSQVFEGMNNGLAEARGKYVVFLNSDDRFCGTKNLAKSLDLFDSENADVGYADTYLERPGKKHRRRHHSDINKLPFGDHFIHQSMVVRAQVMREFGGYDLSQKGTCLENDLTMRLLKAGRKFSRSPYCFCIYSLDGMTGRGTGQRSQHPDIFLKYYGADLGLTLDECIGLRYFVGISYWSESKCRQVLHKLERHPEWAELWRRQIELHFKNGERVLPPVWHRLKLRWEEFGFEGIVESLKRRVARWP